MTLQEKLLQDQKEAMKNKERVRLGVIRLLRAELKNAEIAKGSSLDEGEVLTVLNREVKKRHEALSECEKAGREQMVAELKQELEILKGYLPPQLTEEELRQIISETIKEVDAHGKKDLGKVMRSVMPKVKGRADGGLVNRIVQELLG